MNIRIAWRFTQSDGTTISGVGRWMKDTPTSRRLLKRTLNNVEKSTLTVQVEKWIEEDPLGVFDKQAELFQSIAARGSRQGTKSRKWADGIIRVDYEWDEPTDHLIE